MWTVRAPAISLDKGNSVDDDDQDEFYDASDEPPAFPMLGSIQRAQQPSAAGSTPSFNVVAPPSPTSSTSSYSDASGASTPRASSNTVPAFQFTAPKTSSTKAAARPAPSHRAFAPEPDEVLNGRQVVSRSGGIGSLLPPPTTTTVPTKVRKKFALQPGHSALDWARIMKEGGDDLRAGYDSPQRITLSEVKEHRRRDDAWSVFNGKVYNITPYLNYHPGGVQELMRVAGRDGTDLFMKTHAWVNAELMLEACLIGFLVRE